MYDEDWCEKHNAPQRVVDIHDEDTGDSLPGGRVENYRVFDLACGDSVAVTL